MEFNLAQVHEAVVEANPDRECIIWRDRCLPIASTDRTRRRRTPFADRGLDAHRERSALRGHRVRPGYVGLYLHNGNEDLEGMLGAKGPGSSFNVNYRFWPRV